MSSLDSSSIPGDVSRDVNASSDGSQPPPMTLPYEQSGQTDKPNTTETYLPDEVEKISQLLDDDRPMSAGDAGDLATSGNQSGGGDSEDESIEDYMSRLLERVNQGVSSMTERPAATKQPNMADADGRSTVIVERRPVAEPKVIKEPTEARQPAKPPEDRDDLLNLRQLANASAHDALRIHGCKQLTKNIYRWFATSAGAAVLSCLLVFFSSSASSFTYYGAVVAMLVGIVSGWRYMVGSRKLAKLTSVAMDQRNAENPQASAS